MTEDTLALINTATFAERPTQTEEQKRYEKVINEGKASETGSASDVPVQRVVILGGIRSKGVGSGNWINDMVGDNCTYKTCKCGRLYWGLKRRKTCFYCAV